MKVGFFLPNATIDQPGTPEVGGIESFTFTVGEALQQLGHEVVLFGGRPKPGRTHRPTSLTLELHPYWETKSIPDLGTRFQRLVQRLHFGWSIRKKWKEHRCDVVILAKPFDWPVAWFWKRSQPGLRVIMGFHGTDYFGGDKKFFGAVDRSFAVSRHVAELARRRVGILPELIPNPVDTDLFQPGECPTESEKHRWQIVASGRLVGWKGFHKLVEALFIAQRRATAEGLGALHLAIAGSGPEEDSLRALVKSLKLENAVTFHGRLTHPELLPLLRSSDVYVAPSVGLEAFSIAALEAGCVGLPLILSNQVGLADFLESGEYSTYAAEDIGALAELLLEARRASQAKSFEQEWMRRSKQYLGLRDRFSAKEVAKRILQLAIS